MRFLFILSCFILITLITSNAAFATQRVVPNNSNNLIFSYAPLVKKTAPAVVNIYAKIEVSQNFGNSFDPFFGDPFFQHFFGMNPNRRGIRKRLENSLGSGVIISSDGMVISNAHVIKNAKEIRIVTSGEEEFKAKVIAIDEKTDIAILKIQKENLKLPFLKLSDSDQVEVGDIVLAIGNPFGVGQTVTSGIVSATSRTASEISNFNFFIQTDAAINPGNSGGALIAMDGSLIGINTAIFSKSGGSLGIGFAIPANMVKTVLKSIDNKGKILRPWLGVSAQEITEDIREGLGLKNKSGALVSNIHSASPAIKAGLKTRDIIISINNHKVNSPTELRFRAALVGIGDTINLKIVRENKEKIISFSAISAPEIPKKDIRELEGVFKGVLVANISPAITEEIENLEHNKTGVVIIKNNNPRINSLKRGDVILRINKKKINNSKQLQSITKRIGLGYNEIEVLRNGNVWKMITSR